MLLHRHHTQTHVRQTGDDDLRFLGRRSEEEGIEKYKGCVERSKEERYGGKLRLNEYGQ